MEFAKRINVDEVWFSEIQNWGTYKKEELRKYFHDPILRSKEVRISARLTGKDIYMCGYI